MVVIFEGSSLSNFASLLTFFHFLLGKIHVSRNSEINTFRFYVCVFFVKSSNVIWSRFSVSVFYIRLEEVEVEKEESGFGLTCFLVEHEGSLTAVQVWKKKLKGTGRRGKCRKTKKKVRIFKYWNCKPSLLSPSPHLVLQCLVSIKRSHALKPVAFICRFI